MYIIIDMIEMLINQEEFVMHGMPFIISLGLTTPGVVGLSLDQECFGGGSLTAYLKRARLEYSSIQIP
jgi:hypothetical protein